jgi:serine/threonine protein kinase
MRGTEGYRAPELRTDNPVYSTKTDIWALGCVLHELAFGQPAFRDDWAASDYGRSNKKLEIPTNDLRWDDSDKVALTTMLERTLAVQEFWRPPADDMVILIECIIKVLVGMSPDEPGQSSLLLSPTEEQLPDGPDITADRNEEERSETEPDSQTTSDEEPIPSLQRTIKRQCSQCTKSYAVPRDFIKHDKTWLGQIREYSCTDCQGSFARNEVLHFLI